MIFFSFIKANRSVPLMVIFSLFTGIFDLALAQEVPGTPEKLTHWLSPGEISRWHEIGKSFVETDPPAAPVRNVAEFDYMQGVLIRYPFGIPMALIKEMAEETGVTTIVNSISQQNTVLNQYIANGVDTSHCDFLVAGTDSYWTRDYGPWFVSDSGNQIGIVDFPYNRPRPLDDEIPKLLANYLGIPCYGMNVIHTGGNYMTDGYGMSASTTLVWEENPTQTYDQIDEKMLDYLGIETYRVLQDPNATYIDHIDCWGKFLAPDKILIRSVPSSHPRYQALENMAAYWATQTCSYGYFYRVYRVNTPGDQPYSNSLILNNKVFLPFMNSSWDDSAKAVYQLAMPGYEIIGVPGTTSAPWESTDALHCRTKGIADVGQLFIRHIPLTGDQPCEEDYLIESTILACSHQPVKEDSAFIYYKVDAGDYQGVPMVNISGNHWEGYIPRQQAGSTIYYYLFVADESERRSTCPLIGAADPFQFNTVYTQIMAVPDTLWFLTHDDCTFGKVTMLQNYTGSSIQVSFIETEGTNADFSWFVENPPVVPLNLGTGEAESLRVVIPLPLLDQSGTFVLDTMRIATAEDTIQVIIMVDDSLLYTANERLYQSPDHLGMCFPNPVNDQTIIPLTLTGNGWVILDILSADGMVIRKLVDTGLSAGLHRVAWDARDQSAHLVPGGIYYARLISERGVAVKRIIVVR